MAIDATDYQKYDNPIPSREFILELLKKHGDYLRRDDIAEILKLSQDEPKEALRRRLRAMERDGQVLYSHRQGYSSIDESELLCGRIIGHRDGFGFLKIDSADEDLFIPPNQMRRVFDGDKVQVRISGTDQRGRQEVNILKILERNTDKVTGRLVQEKGQYLLRSTNNRIANTIELNKAQLMGAKSGQIVVADITEYPNHRSNAQAQIREILGDEMAPGMEIDVVLRSYDIPHEWSQETAEAARKFGKHVKHEDKAHRDDLRDFPFVTIDGEDAKDFDDAVYCEPTDTGGWRLFVAIADVSHYVKPDSPLDIAAQE
ncbi:MAG: ribonuclease R, partial [Alteromonadaceae bacterium]